MPIDSPFPAERGCGCKLIRYRLESKPIYVDCCHCRWCQRGTGASFALNAMIEADRVTNLGAEPELVGTLDNPDLLPPDAHIFTASKQPWVTIPDNIPALEEYYYERETLWPPQSLTRRQAILPLIEAYQASLPSHA